MTGGRTHHKLELGVEQYAPILLLWRGARAYKLLLTLIKYYKTVIQGVTGFPVERRYGARRQPRSSGTQLLAERAPGPDAPPTSEAAKFIEHET